MNGHRTPETLILQPLSAAGFAPFGEIIEPAAAVSEYNINDGLTRRYHDIARANSLPATGKSVSVASGAPGNESDRGADMRSSIGFSVFRAKPVTLPFMLRRMERHPLGTQAFINTGNVAFAIVVAPPGSFDAAALRAFLAAPGQSINYHAGTWHHYLLALGRGDFIVVDRIGDGNCDEVELPYPVMLVAGSADGRR
ncbi:MAG: ureidoglycolate lyase [Chromatocurvus sp.]